jgi:sulfonate transport system permease protein
VKHARNAVAPPRAVSSGLRAVVIEAAPLTSRIDATALLPATALPPAAAPRRNDPSWRLHLTNLALPWIVPGALLLLWIVSVRQGWAPPQVLPSPERVLQSLVELGATGELWLHATHSISRVAWGFVIGTSLGLALGVAMALSAGVKDYVYPLFRAFATIPVVGWLPLLMMLVGIDEALKIVLVSKAAFVPVTMNTYNGIRNVPSGYFELARSLSFNRRQLLSKVVFPAAFPSIWTGVRYGLTHAWLALVAVELLASSEGIGFLIVYGRQLYQLDVVFAAVIVVGSVGWILDRVLAAIESHLLHWRRGAF